jgi:hexosaminidase
MLTPNITLFAAGNYFCLNSSIPMMEWVTLSIIGRGNWTYASVTAADGTELLKEAEFLTQIPVIGNLGTVLYYHDAEMAIEAPSKQIGGVGSGWSGQVKSLTLSSVA